MKYIKQASLRNKLKAVAKKMSELEKHRQKTDASLNDAYRAGVRSLKK